MEYMENSQEITGYKVKLRTRPAFRVVGYTALFPPEKPGQSTIPDMWTALRADGSLEKLAACSPAKPWLLGLGSWDPECPIGGQRYTICIEETEHTNFTKLREERPLFTKEIGASDWMGFETTLPCYLDLWKDNPYKMIVDLGYQFHTRPEDYSVGLHFEAYPPGFHPENNPSMEFWITVARP